MKITVTTPTGNIGSKLANRLLDRGADLTVITRDAKKVQDLAARGAHVVAGEHSDAAVLKRALEGAESLFLLHPPDYHTRDLLAHARKFADAASASLSRYPELKVVFLSSVGAHHPSGTGPIRGLHEIEERLRAVAKNVTFLRANYFMENVLNSLATIRQDGNIYSTVPGPAKSPQIATADIAAIAADVILEGKTGQHILDLAGPADISFDQVAETLSRTLGRTVRHVVIPDEALIQGLTSAGISRELAHEFVDMQHAFGRGLTHEFLGEAKLTGQTRFEQFAREVALPAYQKTSASAA